MAYISFQPSDFFNASIYTGTASSQALTGVGFQPDLGWFKARNATEGQAWFDSVRGANEAMYSNTTAAQTTRSSSVMSFDSDGYTLGGDGDTNAAYNYASWNWKGGTTTGLSGGTITPSPYSFSATSGFSIIRYAGNSTSGATIPHGLGVAPEVVMVKRINAISAWSMYWKVLGATQYIYLNIDAGDSADSSFWNNTAPTSTVFSVGNAAYTNTGYNYVAYCFAGVKGYSKFGIYTGNGNTDGPFVYTGFRPACVIQKRSDSTGSWYIYDNKREGYNPNNDYLYPDGNYVEGTADTIDLLSNGFKIDGTTDTSQNASGGEYIYAAFAEFPFVSSNSIPTVAR